jgi:hypothetical protein
MDDLKHTPEEAMLALAELFSKGPRPCKSSGLTYLLEIADGKLVFRRDQICLAIENAINDAYGPKPDHEGDDIVPQKLAKQFPGSFKTPCG